MPFFQHAKRISYQSDEAVQLSALICKKGSKQEQYFGCDQWLDSILAVCQADTFGCGDLIYLAHLKLQALCSMQG